MDIFRKIKNSGEISYVTDTHPTGMCVKLAYHVESYAPEELEPATEEEYLSYKRLRKFISINYARHVVRGQPILSIGEIEAQNPTVSPVGEIRLKTFRSIW